MERGSLQPISATSVCIRHNAKPSVCGCRRPWIRNKKRNSALQISPSSPIVLSCGRAGCWKIIPYGDQPVTGNGAIYTPDTAPIYSLDEDDFIVQESSVGNRTGVTRQCCVEVGLRANH